MAEAAGLNGAGARVEDPPPPAAVEVEPAATDQVPSLPVLMREPTEDDVHGAELDA